MDILSLYIYSISLKIFLFYIYKYFLHQVKVKLWKKIMWNVHDKNIFLSKSETFFQFFIKYVSLYPAPYPEKWIFLCISEAVKIDDQNSVGLGEGPRTKHWEKSCLCQSCLLPSP